MKKYLICSLLSLCASTSALAAKKLDVVNQSDQDVIVREGSWYMSAYTVKAHQTGSNVLDYGLHHLHIGTRVDEAGDLQGVFCRPGDIDNDYIQKRMLVTVYNRGSELACKVEQQ